MRFKSDKIAILGLGYVGMPLAKKFAKKFNVIGFDINQNKIDQLKKFSKIKNAKNISKKGLILTSNEIDLKNSDIFIVTVATPVNKNKIPNLRYLKNASALIGRNLKKNNLVIYESTVYPGLTEDICVPILEKYSGLKFNKDFSVGYSPERVSPGDKNDFTNLNKIVSGSTIEAAKFIYKLYKSIIIADVHIASSIKVAEASKIVENIQRDVNISFMNEISLILSKLKIDTQEVLKAAKTKWNFLDFTPGLVGGHCISVDPYYLTYKAKQHNYNPQVILSGRNINQNMGKYVGNTVVKKIKKIFKFKKKIEIGIFGLTFKENINDTRDSKVFDIINILSKNRFYKIYTFDPYLTKEDIKLPKNISLNKAINKIDVFILAVPHKKFPTFNEKKIKNILRDDNSLIVDIKGVIKNKKIKDNYNYWSL
jgi:UDP-N-acetyl-D-galactosamine dehydrogenase